MPDNTTITLSANLIAYMQQKKSLALAVILTLFFGPFGLLYASVTAGLIMIAAPFILFLFSLPFALLNIETAIFTTILILPAAVLYGVACIVWACIAVKRHNEHLLVQYNLNGSETKQNDIEGTHAQGQNQDPTPANKPEPSHQNIGHNMNSPIADTTTAMNIVNISSYIMAAGFYISIMIILVLAYGVIKETYGGSLSRESAKTIINWSAAISLFCLIGYAICRCLYITAKCAGHYLHAAKSNRNNIPLSSIPAIRQRSRIMGPKTDIKSQQKRRTRNPLSERNAHP